MGFSGHHRPTRKIQRYRTSSKLSSSALGPFLQVFSEAQGTHIADSGLGKPFDVDKLGPCLPPDNEARLDTLSCVLEATDPDPALSESGAPISLFNRALL